MATLAKPGWLAEHLPGLDGLRGLAIALVLLHHCAPRLVTLGLGAVADWGWTGVDLFFVLSGFLITGIVLDGRQAPLFFRNFYARRGLRILPVFALVLVVNIVVYGRGNTWSRPGPYWLYFVLFIHNLTPGLTGTIYPSWSLAIEEQFYAVWAPVARRLPARAMALLLLAVLAAEPWVRHHVSWFVTTNTLYHLDGLAIGALIALALRCRAWTRLRWASLGLAAMAVGLVG
ncbi:MAG: acyltransferase family protein, partial [Terriglobales bacterium]